MLLMIKEMQILLRNYFVIQLAIQLLNYLPHLKDLDQIQYTITTKIFQVCLHLHSNVTEDLVLQLFKDMNIDKAANIIFQENFYGANILAKPISELCNLSIKYSLFPKDCQIAKLKPLFKKTSKRLPKNYHPISLLSLIFKITEKVIHNQTQAFLDKNKILYRFQSGFGKQPFISKQ